MKSSQSMASKILFENIDKTVDYNGYPNRFPVHLKNLAVSGLPADEVPIIEIRDIHGQVYNSNHADSEVPTWSIEFGDGSFQVSNDILGDFVISCRFGGKHSAIKDSSTVIFTYQNNTAFLPCEVVELRRNNMDVNSAYASSLDEEIFAVHLMFEEPLPDENQPVISPQKDVFGRSNFVLPAYTSPSGKAGVAFERGLDEICKNHQLDADPQLLNRLEQAGHAPRFILAALKLSNNSEEQALVLLEKMVARSADIKGDVVQDEKLSAVPFSGIPKSPSNVSLSYSAVGPEANIHAHAPTQLTGKRIDVDPFTGLNTLLTDGDLDIPDDDDSVDSAKEEEVIEEDDGDTNSKSDDFDPGPPCSQCNDDVLEKRDQLVPCSACHRQFHSFCLGRRPVPHSIKTNKDRQSRSKYLLQNYRFWRCSMCATKDLADSLKTESSSEELAMRRNSDSMLSSPVTVPRVEPTSKADLPAERTASWCAPASGSKVSFATTFPVGSAPKPPPVAAPPVRRTPGLPTSMMTPLPTRRSSATDRPSKSARVASKELSACREMPVQPPPPPASTGASWMFKSRMSHSILPAQPPPPRSQTKHEQAAALMGLLAASGLTMESLLQMNVDKQRETLIAAATIRNSSRLTETERLQLRKGQSVESDAAIKRVSRKAMVSFRMSSTPEGLESPESVQPRQPSIGHDRMSKGRSGDADPRRAILDMLEEEAAPAPAADPRKAMMAMLAKRGGGGDEEAAPAPAADPRKAMMAMLAKRGGGGDEEAAPAPAADPRKAMMAMLAKRGGGGDEEAAPAPAADPRKAMLAMMAKRGGGGDEEAASAPSSTSVPLKDCVKFGKYFKMMKVGLPKPAVVQKMMSDGVVTSEEEGSSLLEKGGDAPSPIPGVAVRKVTMELPEKQESSSAASGAVLLKDCPKYGKYFKMMKVGLPKPAVVQKMMSDGVVASEEEGSSLLEKGGDAPSPIPGVGGSASSGAAVADAKKGMTALMAKRGGGESSGPQILLKDHPSYAKYFKMLKVGMPKDNVKFKMEQDGIDKNVLDKDPESMVSSGVGAVGGAEKDADNVAVSYHPRYGKYFRMLSVRLPRDAIKAKMEADGMDPAFLDKNPSELIPIEEENEGNEDTLSAMPGTQAPPITFADHPQYGKFFKMLKVGLPKEAVKAKMTNEGLNPDYLDMNATDLMPQAQPSGPRGKANRVKSQRIKSQRIKNGAITLTVLGAGAKGAPKVRKKKLYWKALSAKQVGNDSMWNEADDDITLDEAEFNMLFVESDDAPKKDKVDDGAEKAKALEESKRKKVNLIDAKRGQNAGIALARIKVGFTEVRERILLMKDEVFTTDQLRYLLEYLPSEEESGIIGSYTGDADMLGQAEKYMKEMSGFPTAAKHIQAMIYKQQLSVRVAECCTTLTAIESACDDVKMSTGFKKILKTILKVGNQMNDGEKHLGFTLDSLLKLQSAKAFDKKTSILQYVITLIYRNDEKSLDFPNDLTHCAEASRLTLDSAHQEQVALKQGHEASVRIVAESMKGDPPANVLAAMSVMTSFLSDAKQRLEELSAKVDGVKKKFANVLAYFGEEASMSSQDFFSTLTAFIQEFVGARDNLERVRRMEKVKEKREKDLAEKQRLKELKEAQLKDPNNGRESPKKESSQKNLGGGKSTPQRGIVKMVSTGEALV